MGLMDWLLGSDAPADVEDPEKDIGDIPLDYFWAKIEANLPEDWTVMLASAKDPAYPRYRLYTLKAFLADPTIEDPPSITTAPRHKLKRALEDMFYSLRDML